ncbi:hypothetical protein [Microbacterium sp. BH-3-3-3]|uniref:arsenate reductase/protein-tyrosine-phosphatase family protein n=1 Tax=Microbacterium sp. BH-3-3-3 TaxID=1906742 RepID=UPI0009F5A770|nr:hypothetical protein [Microbacterium sp. BH-3-3-3]
MSFTILSVCTGNVCRSPVAEFALAALLADEGGVSVESAGTGALTGESVPEPGQRIAMEYDVDASHHTARQVSAPLIRSADLILGMAREHRRYAAETLPAAMRRSFTLRELARIAEAAHSDLPAYVRGSGATTADDGMRAAVAFAASLRGTIAPPSDASEFDVIDPYRRSDETYRTSFGQLVPAARSVAAYLRAGARLAEANQ